MAGGAHSAHAERNPAMNREFRCEGKLIDGKVLLQGSNAPYGPPKKRGANARRNQLAFLRGPKSRTNQNF